jgi:hypothetical protein
MIDISNEREGAFREALEKVEPGDPIVYHIGPHCGGVHRRDAMAASDAGEVCLVQSRGGPGQFIYIARKTKGKKK